MSTDFVGIAGQRTIEFCCDTCGETFDTEKETFGEANATAKAEGWRFRKSYRSGVGEEWEHFCPECAS